MVVKKPKRKYVRKLKPEVVPVKFSRSILLTKRLRFFTISFIIVSLLSLPFLRTKRLHAEEEVFYPGSCTGSWLNTETVAGGNESKTETGPLAKATGAAQELICSSFTGELPLGANVTTAELEFVWVLGKKDSVDPVLPVESSFDAGNEQLPVINDSVLPTNDNTSSTIEDKQEELKTDQPIESTNEVVPEKGIDLAPAENNIEVIPPAAPNQGEPASFLPNFINIARAQEDIPASIDVVTEPVVIQDEIQITTPELNNSNDSGSQIIINESNEVAPQTNETVINNVSEAIPVATGTALFDISYGLGESPWEFLSQVEQDNLNTRYPLSITKDDIPNLKISLMSHLSIDDISNFSLSAIKLIITYDGLNGDMGEPNLKTDTLIKEVSDDRYWVVLVQRQKNKAYEIWYTDVSEKALMLPTAKKLSKEATILDAAINLLTPNSDLITPVVEPEISAVVDPQVENIIDSEKKPIENATDVNNEKKVTETEKPALETKSIWNFVAKDGLVGELSSLDVVNGVIIWLSPDNNAAILFDIPSQVITSQTLEPTGETLIDFNDELYSLTPLNGNINSKIKEKIKIDSNGDIINQ